MNRYIQLSYKDIAAEVTTYIVNISSQVSNISYLYSMLKAEYRKIQQKTDGETLLVTIPTEFAHAIQLQRSDTVKMTLQNKTIVVQRAT